MGNGQVRIPHRKRVEVAVIVILILLAATQALLPIRGRLCADVRPPGPCQLGHVGGHQERHREEQGQEGDHNNSGGQYALQVVAAQPAAEWQRRWLSVSATVPDTGGHRCDSESSEQLVHARTHETLCGECDGAGLHLWALYRPGHATASATDQNDVPAAATIDTENAKDLRLVMSSGNY